MKARSKKPFSESSPTLTLEVRVQPRSGRRELWKEPGGRLRAALQATPEGGKANDELVRLVAERLGIARSRVELWKGHKSRQKILRVWNVDLGQLNKALESLECR